MPEKIKILFIFDGLRVGGKERRIVELLKILSKVDKYSIAACSTRREILYDEFNELNLPVSFFIKKEGSFSKSVRGLNQRIKEFNPDIVHAWSSYAVTLAISAKIWGAKSYKLINSQITNVPPQIKRFSRPWVQSRFNFWFSDAILSNTIKGIEKYMAPQSKSHCIYNGFDMNRVEGLEPISMAKANYGLKDSDKTVGMVGALQPKKDFPCFIKAGIELLSQGVDVHFFIVGDGAEREKLEKSIPLTYKERFIFTGNLKKVENLIQIFDIGVLCTNSKVHGEGVSNVLLEMMALGKSVVATDGGGTSEVISNEENGFIIPPGDSESLSNVLGRLLGNRTERDTIGLKAKEQVVLKFDNEKNNYQYIELYTALL